MILGHVWDILSFNPDTDGQFITFICAKIVALTDNSKIKQKGIGMAQFQKGNRF